MCVLLLTNGQFYFYSCLAIFSLDGYTQISKNLRNNFLLIFIEYLIIPNNNDRNII